MNRLAVLPGALAAALALATTSAPASDIENPMPTALDNFGIAVAATATRVLVGADLEDPPGTNAAGAAYLFDLQTGALIESWFGQANGAGLGGAVALTDTHAAIAAPKEANGGQTVAGAVRLIELATDTEQVLRGDTRNDFFGKSLAMTGAYLAVGATGDDPVSEVAPRGTVSVFAVSDASLVDDFVGESSGDNFGWSVAVDGNLLLVGAWAHDAGGLTDAGAAYLYDLTDGSLVHKFEGPAEYGLFGWSVALSGNRALVGAPGPDNGIPMESVGRAYLFDTESGALLETFEDGIAGGVFGDSVALGEGVALIGAPQDQPGGVFQAGSAYVYELASGGLVETYDGTGFLFRVGDAVAIGGTNALLGAPSAPVGSTFSAGSVFRETLPEVASAATERVPFPPVAIGVGALALGLVARRRLESCV